MGITQKKRNSVNNGDKNISCVKLKKALDIVAVVLLESSLRFSFFCEKEGCCVGHVSIYVIAPERKE